MRMKKQLMYKLRKPLSYLLAFILLLSTLSVGLTVWAADVSKEKEPTLSERLNALSAEEKTAAEMTWDEFNAKLDSIKNDNDALYQFLADQLDEEMVDYVLSDIRDSKIDPANMTFEELMNGDLGTMGSTNSSNTRYGYYVRDLPNGQVTKFAMTYWAIFNKNKSTSGEYSDMHWVFEMVYNGLKALLPDQITYAINGTSTEPRADTWNRETQANQKYALFIRIFSGMWEVWASPTSSNYQKRWNTTILPASESAYLTQYATIDEMPDAIPTQFGIAASQQRIRSGWSYTYTTLNLGTVGGFLNTESYWTPFANSGISYGPDTTSKAALTAFAEMFTSDILNIESITELSNARIHEIVNNAGVVVAGTEKFGEAVANHFFPKTESDTYEGTAFERAKAIYEEAVTYTEEAAANYAPTIEEANMLYGGNKILKAEDLAPMEALLLEAVDYYNVLSEEQKADGTIAAAYATYLELADKLAQYQDIIYKSEYQTYVAQLANKLKQDLVKEYFSSNPAADDNMRGTIAEVLSIYYEAVQRLISLQPEKNTAELLRAQIYDDLLAMVGEDDFIRWDMSNKLALLSCSGSENTGSVSLTVDSNPLLYTYNNIAEIPASFPFSRTVLTYRYVNGVLTNKNNIRLVTTEETDSTAYSVFQQWAAAFDSAFMADDLSTWDIAQLTEKREAIQKAIEAVKPYSEKTLAHLLAAPYATPAEAEAKLDDVQNAIADLFVAKAAAMMDTYGSLEDTGMTTEESLVFIERFTEVLLYYSQIDAAYLERADVAASKQAVDDLLNRFDSYRVGLYLNIASGLNDYLVDGQPNVTLGNMLELQRLLDRINSAYEDLTDEQKQNVEVQTYQGLLPAFQVLIDNAYETPVWTETTVDYSGIENATEEVLNNTIGKLDDTLAALLPTLMGLEDGATVGDFLLDTIGDMLYSADTVNAVMQTVYPMMWLELKKAVDDAIAANGSFVVETLGGIKHSTIESKAGIQARPAQLIDTNCIYSKYTKVIEELKKAPGLSDTSDNVWDNVTWENMDWVDYSDPANPVPIHDFDTFCEALGSALTGAWKLLRIMLYDEDLTLSGLASIMGSQMSGAPGYESIIIPFYKQLGCTGYDTYDNMNSNGVYGNAPEHLKKLLNPILNRVKEIGEAPIEGLIDFLPQLAYILHYDLLIKNLNALVRPIGLDVGSMLPIDLSDINALLAGLDLGGLKLPYINTGEIAGIATKEDGGGYGADFAEQWNNSHSADADKIPVLPGAKLEVKSDEMFVYLLRLILDTVKENQDMIMGLLGEEPDPMVEGLLTKVLSNDNDTIINSLLGFLNPAEIPNVDWDMSEWNWSESEALYPSGLSNKDAAKAVEKLDQLINAVVSEFLQTDLTSLVGGALFTEENLNNLTMTIYRGIETAGLSDVLAMVGFDVSQQAVAKAVESLSPKAAEKILAADSWASVDLTGSAWAGFSSTSSSKSDAFAAALAAILQPFNPILRTLLAGEDITLLGGLTIAGANGYTNAVLPLMQALQCNDYLSAEDYNALITESPDQVLVSILLPLFDTMNEVLANPVGVLADKLPNFANFMANGGLTKALNALILPITNMAEPLLELFAEDGETLDLISFVVDLLGIELPEGLNLNDLENSIIPVVNNFLNEITVGGVTVSLALKPIDWATLAGHGTQAPSTNVFAKLFKSGNPSYFTVQSDVGDTAMAVLNYLVDTVKLNQNALLAVLRDQLMDSASDNVLNVVEDIIVRMMNNPSQDISGAIIQVINAENPADVDWNAYDFIWALAEAIYPEGVSDARVEEAITVLDKAVTNILNDVLGTSLTQIVGGALYTTENLEMLVNGIYGALEGQEEILGMLNITLPSVSSLQLNGNNRQNFVKGLSDALAPFAPVLGVLLNGDNLTVQNTLTIKGANGYKNAVLPLLYALGCDTALSASDYKDAVKNSDSALISEIINPVLDLAEKIMNQPVDTLTSILPNFAYFISNGGISKAFNNLLLPFSNVADPVLSLVTDKSMLNYVMEVVEELTGTKIPVDFDHIEDSVLPILNSVLADVEMNGQKGFQLPSIDWSKLAGYGELKNRTNPVVAVLNGTGNSVMNKYVEANKADTLLAVMRYLLNTVKYGKNAEIIKNIVASLGNATVDEIAGNILNASDDQLIAIIMQLLVPTGEKSPANWVYFQVIKESAVTYTKHLTKEDFENSIGTIDENLLGLLNQLAGIGSLTSLLSDNLYTQEMASQLAETVFGMLNEETLGIDIISTLQMVGIDLSPRGVASKLTAPRYAYAVLKLNAADSWADVNFGGISWGFTNGDRDAFIGTLVALLRPLEPVLRYVLTGEDLVLFDSVRLTGGDGYNNAIIPLLETLQCSNIKSAAEYKARVDKNSDFLLLDIIDPIFDKVEELLEKPVDTITSLLPNIGLFMANDGVEQLAENLLLPITDLLGTVSPIYKLTINLSNLRNINLADMVNDILAGVEVNGSPLGIKLLPINWKTMASRGAQTSMLSQRVDENGQRVVVPAVKADKAAVLISTLRYLINTIKDPNNLGTITSLLEGLDSSGMVTSILGAITDSSTDDVVELLMTLLAGVDIDDDTPSVSNPPSSSGTVTTTPSTTTPSTTQPEQTTQSQNNGSQQNSENNENQGGENETKKKANLPLIIGCSVGGLVIIGLAVYFIIRSKKKRSLAQGSEKELAESVSTK